MINEETTNKTLHMEVQGAKYVAKEIYKLLNKLLVTLDKKKQSLETHLKNSSSEVKLKDMVKKGQLEEIEVTETDLKNLKKELNRHGVKFSVMKDKISGNYSVFFQAKDLAVMEKAFRNAVQLVNTKEVYKESITKTINKLKEKIKETVTKDKVKHKQKEQSL